MLQIRRRIARSADLGDSQRSCDHVISKAGSLRRFQADKEVGAIGSADAWHDMQDRTRGPQFGRLEIAKEHIGRLVGPNGSALRGIEDSTGARVTLQDDGVVHYFAPTPKKFKAAEDTIGSITGNTIKASPAALHLLTPSPVLVPKSRSPIQAVGGITVVSVQEGDKYRVTVKRLQDYGAFVELPNGYQTLLHISEISHTRVGGCPQPSVFMSQHAANSSHDATWSCYARALLSS